MVSNSTDSDPVFVLVGSQKDLPRYINLSIIERYHMRKL